MADIRFTELAIAERLDLSAIVAIVMNHNGETVSLKCSVSQIAEFIVNGIEFQGLTSDDKKIIGAINELIAKVDDLELFKFPNATIIGTPTINNGQISGFSQTSYLQFPFLMDFQGRHFAINMEFTTAADVTNQQNIFDSDFGLAFAIRSAKFVIAVSSNGTSWNIGEGVGTHTVLPNTTYRVQLSWNGTAYKLSYSLNGGESYTEDISLASTASPFPKQVYIGVGENYASVLNFFKGIINLNYASLYVADSLVWQGMDDVGLASRLATDLSNIDAAGEQRIKDIAGGGGEDVTKAYVDQQDAALQTQIDDEKAEIQQLKKQAYLVEEFTLGEDLSTIDKSVEPSGTPYNFESLVVVVDATAVTLTSDCLMWLRLNHTNSARWAYAGYGEISQAYRYGVFKWIKLPNGFIDSQFARANGKANTSYSGYSVSSYSDIPSNVVRLNTIINDFRLYTLSAKIPAGTKISIYGVKA